MANELVLNDQLGFDKIKHINENGIEFWYARELMLVLDYKEWRKFEGVIEKARTTCQNSGINEFEHFVDADKLSKRANNAEVIIKDYKLTRYACYLIAQNGDSRKETIASAQTYFAIQTRKQELTEQEYQALNEDERRLYTRQNIKDKNKFLYKTAQESGVTNYGKFTNYGYRGLYNGETASDIKKRKGIEEKEDILDYMGSTELAANLFRITQTDEVLKNKKVNNEEEACLTHHDVGQAVRQTIKRIGGTMPENLPTPEKSIKQIEKEAKALKRLNSNKKKKLNK